jgi:hypothetical protein
MFPVHRFLISKRTVLLLFGPQGPLDYPRDPPKPPEV